MSRFVQVKWKDADGEHAAIGWLSRPVKTFRHPEVVHLNFAAQFNGWQPASIQIETADITQISTFTMLDRSDSESIREFLEA